MITFGINSAFLFAIWGGGILWGEHFDPLRRNVIILFRSSGVFTCAFTYALYVLRRAHVKNEGHRSLYISGITIIVLYLLATIYLCLGVFQVYVGFIQTPTDQQIDYFFDNSGGVNQAKNFIYLFSMWISDGVVVWRCYAIWNHSKRIIAVPVLLLCMTIVLGPCPEHRERRELGYRALRRLADPERRHDDPDRRPPLVPCVGVAVPGEKMKQRYRTIILAIIDSAAAMAAARIIEFVLFMISPDGPVGNNAFYTVTDLMPQISGIVPTAIVVVVHARRGVIDTYRETIAGAHSIAFHPRTVTTDTYDVEHSSSGFTTDHRGVNVGLTMAQSDTSDFKSGHLRTVVTTSSGADTKQG
ncbi:hypothetical protein EWM64_g4170 [Hericium alpestre]|uniref:Uncharacterized protein n=1 Tax=Hericium alpestre TaxID=135208 RepID=A0A4Y9ZYE5_9AGAM|nr:hypothetical protein EWM64_g4170 [Hericium alpestre]